jgi:anti-sigma B factor antagonist
VVVAVTGDLDHTTAPGLRLQLNETIAEHPRSTVCVDMSAVTFMDSVGLGVLIFAYKRAVQAGSSLTVVNPSRRVAGVLDTTGMARILCPAPARRG